MPIPKKPFEPNESKDLPDFSEPLAEIPGREIKRIDRIIESDDTVMQAPKDWPPPPEENNEICGD